MIYPPVVAIRKVPEIIAGFQRMRFLNCAGAIDDRCIPVICPPQVGMNVWTKKLTVLSFNKGWLDLPRADCWIQMWETLQRFMMPGCWKDQDWPLKGEVGSWFSAKHHKHKPSGNRKGMSHYLTARWNPIALPHPRPACAACLSDRKGQVTGTDYSICNPPKEKKML